MHLLMSAFRGIDDLHRFCAFTLLSCDALMTVNAMRQLSTGAQPAPNNAIHLAKLSVPDRGCRPTTWTADLTANETLRECTRQQESRLDIDTSCFLDMHGRVCSSHKLQAVQNAFYASISIHPV